MSEVTSLAEVRGSTNELVPYGFDKAKEMADMLSKSSFCPPDMAGKSVDVLFTIMAGNDLGYLPMSALRLLVPIRGKLCELAQGMAARINASPECEFFYVEDDECDAEKAVVYCRRRGWPQKKTARVVFEIGEAEKLGLLGRDNWKKQRETMLVWRAVAKAGRRHFADIVAGLLTPEEAAPDLNVDTSGRVIAEPLLVDVVKTPTPSEDIVDVEVEKPAEESKPKAKKKRKSKKTAAPAEEPKAEAGDTEPDVAVRLITARQNKKLTIPQLAKEAEVSEETVRLAEVGAAELNMNDCLRLAGTLDIPVDELMPLMKKTGRDQQQTLVE